MSYLTLRTHIQAYDDADQTSSPVLRHVDWSRTQQGIEVERPGSRVLAIPPATETVLFDGARTLSADATTELAVSLSTLAADRYRVAHTSTGTAPAFKTVRAFGANGNTLTLTVLANATVRVSGAGPTYTNVSVGDLVLIPGITTGDTGPFAQDNEGLWSVIGRTNTTLTLARPTGVSFTAITEAVAVTSATQFQVFADDRVQVGDTLEILGGLSVAVQHAYEVLSVAPGYVEIRSSRPLAAETAVLGSAANIKAYTDAVRLTYVEADQELSVRVNGDAGDTTRLEPWVAGADPGIYLRTGTTWRLALYNRASVAANVLYATAV